MDVLVDGAGAKLIAIRGKSLIGYHNSNEDSMSEIVIETDKGNYVISGCHACSGIFLNKLKQR